MSIDIVSHPSRVSLCLGLMGVSILVFVDRALEGENSDWHYIPDIKN
jgi:hypothetical protein